MKPYFGMFREELLDGRCLVRRKIIQHDVNLARPLRLVHQSAQEIDEIRAGVPPRCFSLYYSGLHIQRRVQRQRAVAIIFKSVALGSTRRQGSKRALSGYGAQDE